MIPLQTALRGAVDRGEITAAFQPQTDLRDGGVVAAEVLCRWHHPELGDVPAIDFIGAAEDSGLIDEIGRFMAELAVRALVRWKIDISVNVSPAQLESNGFTEWLTRRLSHVYTHGESLTLEITESRPILDLAPVLRRLAPLRDLGVGIALDDFGTGHSSITQLKRLHGSELKLDRSLVTDASAEAAGRMAEAIEVAHSSGIRVVAEGIEEYADLSRARDLGCDRGQGYLLGRPATAEDFARLI